MLSPCRCMRRGSISLTRRIIVKLLRKLSFSYSYLSCFMKTPRVSVGILITSGVRISELQLCTPDGLPGESNKFELKAHSLGPFLNQVRTRRHQCFSFCSLSQSTHKVRNMNLQTQPPSCHSSVSFLII